MARSDEDRSGCAVALEPPEDEIEQSSQGLQDAAKLVGLCATCELRETCDRPKPAGGIWFCEEYQ